MSLLTRIQNWFASLWSRPQILQPSRSQPFIVKSVFALNHEDSVPQSEGVSVLLTAAVSPGKQSTRHVILRYLDEGAANVIWTIKDVENGSFPEVHDNKLLRLRKGTKSQSYSKSRPSPPPYLPSTAVFEHWNEFVKPEFLLYPDNLVHQELATVTAEVISECNKVLDHLEETGVRPEKRHGWHIEQHESAALVITSMAPDPSHSVQVHMKPKWLAQSPGAPDGAIRCRTCALHAFRATPKHKLPVCPLTFVSGDQTLVRHAVSNLPDSAISPLPPGLTPGDIELELTKFFMNTNLLSHIRDLQVMYDPRGVKDITENIAASKSDTRDPTNSISSVHRLGLAMTFRDCSLFIKIYKEPGIDVEARLADLDPKTDWKDMHSLETQSKLTKWAYDEAILVEEGWYLGTEILGEEAQRHQSCLLWKD